MVQAAISLRLPAPLFASRFVLPQNHMKGGSHMLDKWIIIRRKRYWPWRVDISFFMKEKTTQHLSIKWRVAWSNARMEGGAKGGATVGLYQNGGYDEPLQMRLARSPQRSLHRPDLFPHTPAYDLFPCTVDIRATVSSHVECVLLMSKAQ